VNALLIANFQAGPLRSKNLSQLKRQLEAHHIYSEIINAPNRAQAIEAIKKALAAEPDRFQRILVAGGDGTLNAVLTALMEFSDSEKGFSPLPPLGILPLGTVNVLARDLAIPMEIKKAITVAERGIPRFLDIGLFQEQPFLLMSGLGFDGAVVRAVRPRIKSIIGPVAYVLEALRLVFSHPTHQFQITCDGKTHEIPAWLVVIANTPGYAYKLCLAPQAKIDDNLLDVCIFPDYGWRTRLKQAFLLLCNRPRHCPLLYFAARQVEVRVSPPVGVQLDGEPGPIIEIACFISLAKKFQVMTPDNKGEQI
jgi:YegS/Rv2252/BmrU family lipid kinase